MRRAILVKNDRNDTLYVFEKSPQSDPDGSIVHVVPFDIISQPVDKTGSMDAFSGGFAAAIAEGFDVVEAAHFASKVASLSEQRTGTAEAMPYLMEVKMALRTETHEKTRKSVEAKSISERQSILLNSPDENNSVIDNNIIIPLFEADIHSIDTNSIIEKNRNMGLDAYTKLYGFLQEQGVHNDDIHELVVEFRRNVELARDKRRPKWSERHNHENLANLTPPEFLMEVYKDKMHENQVVKKRFVKSIPI